MKLLDWISIFILFIIVIASIVFAFFLFKEAVNECTSDPIIYGTKKFEQDYGYEVIGRMYLKTPIGLQQPIFAFNSENMTRIQ